MKETQIQEQMQGMETQLQEKKRIARQYSTIRFLLLLMMIACIYFWYTHSSDLFAILFVIGFLIFLWFVRLHMKVRSQIEQWEAQVESLQDILARRQEGWKAFQDQGDAFLNETTTQAYDLDVFGPASLYQYICVAKTPFGRSCLASCLSCKKQAHSSIIQRQIAVQELAQMLPFSVMMSAMLKLFDRHGRKKKKSTLEDFFSFMERDTKTYPTICMWLARLVSLLVIVSIIASGFHLISYAIPVALATLSVAISMLFVMKNAPFFQDVSIMENTMMDYEKIFTALHKREFQSAKLQAILAAIKDAPMAIRSLHHIMTAIHFRNDGILFIITNGLFLLDFQCVFALAKWKRQYGKQVRVWMQKLGEFEALLSLSQLNHAKDCITNPLVSKRVGPYLQISDVYHPLICERDVVANTCELIGDTYVITGSNMSGKTTFLRAIGLNMILFHAGASVCASACEATSMNIYTSMRIRDDVSEGISTFYAEILRIKEMIQESEKKEDMIVLIDEIFKGTNSADRIICAKEVLKQLHLSWVTTMVSTHDFELCTLTFEHEKQAINYHFSEHYVDNQIQFDYLLKPGRCTTTNALQLLRMAGISIA